MRRSGGAHHYGDIVVHDGMWRGQCTCGHRTSDHHYAETAMAMLIDHIVNERAAGKRATRMGLVFSTLWSHREA